MHLSGKPGLTLGIHEDTSRRSRSRRLTLSARPRARRGNAYRDVAISGAFQKDVSHDDRRAIDFCDRKNVRRRASFDDLGGTGLNPTVYCNEIALYNAELSKSQGGVQYTVLWLAVVTRAVVPGDWAEAGTDRRETCT